MIPRRYFFAFLAGLCVFPWSKARAMRNESAAVKCYTEAEHKAARPHEFNLVGTGPIQFTLPAQSVPGSTWKIYDADGTLLQEARYD